MANAGVPKQIFLSIQGQQYGPVDMVTLQSWIEEKRVNDQTPCWCQDLPEWMPLGQAFPQLFVQAPAPPPMPTGPPPMQPAFPVDPEPAPFLPPAPVLIEKKAKKSKIWLWLILFLFLIALIVIGGFFLIPMLLKNKEVLSVSAQCKATVLIVEGKEFNTSSIDFWNIQLSPIIQNEEKTMIVMDGNTLQISSTEQSLFGDGTITNTLNIEVDSDWNQIISCTWERKEETEQYTMETRVEVMNLEKTSAPDSNTLVFSCQSIGCKDLITISETVDWPSHADFNQHLNEIFWEQEGDFTLTIEMSQP